MKRGDYAALVLFVLQAAVAFWYARGLATIIPPLGDLYFQVPIWPLKEALSSTRTLGYPLFHAFVASQGQGLPAYPEAQMLILIPCVLAFGVGLRAYGLTGLAALAAASPLLWIVPVEHVIPETLAKCFAIAAAGFLLWASGTRRAFPYLGLALTLFVACQMRPAFLFLVAWAPAAWIFLYTRRWGLLHQALWLKHGARCLAACILPLFLFCLLRLVLVGHFGLVSFGGQNTIGISIELIDSQTVSRLPVGDRPLGQMLARGRDAWPERRFITRKGLIDDWHEIAPTYAANVNRTGRALQAKFPPADGESGNVERDKALSRLSMHTFLVEWPMYRDWLVGAAVESFRMVVFLLLGGGGDEGFGLGPQTSLLLALALVALLLLCWPIERRAFGEGSRPHFARAVTVLLFVCGTFFLTKMLLVILVEPPIARYVEAAAFLLPCVVTGLFWDRGVVLAAALCKRPHWYNGCYAAYPAVPDTPRALPWRAWLQRARGQRRTMLITLAAVALLVATLRWSTRDNRLFHALATKPDSVREALMEPNPPIDWRADDGATLLHYAALYDDTALLQHLLAEGAEPAATARDGASALHWAALGGGDGSVVPLLLAAGVPAANAGALDLSPAHLAALFSNTGCLSALLDGGADPNVPSSMGVTPLHVAGSLETASLLLDRGATLDATDSTGATPLQWAPDRRIAGYLLDRGANINAREDWRSFVRGCTPLLKAAYQGDDETAYWLLDRGADPNAGDINNLSPIYYAIWRGNLTLLQALLDRGADPMHPGRWAAYSPTSTSARFTDLFGKAVGRHSKRDTFPNLIHDEAVMRPLDWAAFLGNTQAMEILIARGAQFEAHNAYGMSALHWAILGNCDPPEKMLRALDPGLKRLDDSRLPVGPYRAAVVAGKRELGPALRAEATIAAPQAVPLPSPAAASPHIAAPSLETLRAAARREANALDKGAPDVLVAEKGFLFTRKACNYLLEIDFLHASPGDATSGPSAALTAILDMHRQLEARGIRLVVVPVPIAIEVHADAFLPGWDLQQPAVPARAAFIQGLREAGVHAIDLLPAFVQARAGDPELTLYLKEDGHWNSTAMGIAAGEIATDLRQSLSELPWDGTLFTAVDIELQPGASVLVDRLPEDMRPSYVAPRWPLRQIHAADGSLYKDDDASPILVAGDSYTLMFQEVSGQFSARLAKALGHPVALLGGKAAGPSTARLLARRGKEFIDARKALVWVFSAAYIRPTGQEQWEMLALP